mgnify:FL=1|jgi:hypothetical protein
MKHFVNFALLIAFLVLATSAALRFFQPFSLAVTRIHIVFGSLILILVGLHLSSRLGYFAKMLKQRPRKPFSSPNSIRLLLLPIVVCAYLLSACLSNWWPVPQLLSIGYESKNRATIFRAESGASIRSIDNRTQLKRNTSQDASVLVEIDWGSAFDPVAEFPTPFSGARPQIAIWAESSVGALIETFFVSEESAFSESFEWDGNERRRVDILPVWRHQFTLASGIEPDGDIDTYSGATPEHSFSIENYLHEDPNGFYLSVEINVPNDSNEHYHSDQDTNEGGYTLPGIGQPSIYYSAYIDPNAAQRYYLMEFVGHGGSSNQQSGDIYYDSSELTTARDLIEKILVRIQRP